MRVIGTLDLKVQFQVVEDAEGQPGIIYAVVGQGSDHTDDADSAVNGVREIIDRKLVKFLESLD